MSSMNLPAKFAQFKSQDPFPEIPPALLNSADIADYANTVGILDPFDPDRLKSASYEIRFAGSVFWWKPGTKERQQQEIRAEGDVFEIESNAIAYVSPDTQLFLPDYLAARFNFQIREVHRGLILGTGPIVDPGFCGHLLIPLHNLTANKYVLRYDDGFIWVEFTKISPNRKWQGAKAGEVPRTGTYVEFKSNKRFLSASTYFSKANGNRDIVSSIPDAFQQSQKAAKEAAENAEAAKKDAGVAASRSSRTLWLTLAGIVITIWAGGLQLVSIFETSASMMIESRAKASEEIQRSQVESLRREIEQLRKDVAAKQARERSSPPKDGMPKK